MGRSPLGAWLGLSLERCGVSDREILWVCHSCRMIGSEAEATAHRITRGHAVEQLSSDETTPPSYQSRVRLTAQQRAVLRALREQSPLPTTILRDVRVLRRDAFPSMYRTDDPRSYAIGEPVASVLRRLERRGLVTGEMGSECKDWWISDAGLEAIE